MRDRLSVYLNDARLPYPIKVMIYALLILFHLCRTGGLLWGQNSPNERTNIEMNKSCEQLFLCLCVCVVCVVFLCVEHFLEEKLLRLTVSLWSCSHGGECTCFQSWSGDRIMYPPLGYRLLFFLYPLSLYSLSSSSSCLENAMPPKAAIDP